MKDAGATIMRIEDAGLTVADPADDIRGRTVVGPTGEEVGTIRSLLIDERESRVRLLEVRSGGFLGLGGTSRLVPVDAIGRIDEDVVRVDQTRTSVETSPVYDPDVAAHPAYYGSVYAHYGYLPFWVPASQLPSEHGRDAHRDRDTETPPPSG